MYTNLGFFRRDYNKSHSPKSTYELRLPRIQHLSSPSARSGISPGSFSYKNLASATRNNYSNNIFNQYSVKAESNSARLAGSYNFNSGNRIGDKQFLPKTNYIGYSIFEIHQIGYSSQHPGYGGAAGIGFLITKSLALTANTVIPDENVASRCLAHFVDNLSEAHSFDPELFFYSNKDLNVTILGFVANPESKKPRLPIEIREEFTLQPGDLISYLNSGNNYKNVSLVEEEMFIYTAGNTILPGMPLFTLNGKLQGFHHTCTSSYKFNQGTRIDVIYKSLQNIRSVVTHPELGSIMTTKSSLNSSQSAYITPNAYYDEPLSNEGRYIYWVEWYNSNLYRYDIPQEKWNKVIINNFNYFLSQETDEWSFNWGSRVLYTEKSVFILGGIGKNPQTPRSDVFEFSTETNEIVRKKNMIEKREGMGVVSSSNYIYALGGKYSYNACERFSIKDNRWDVIAPMNFGRYEPVAVVLNDEKNIFVIGGFPQDTVGKSIEKFDVESNHWGVVSIILPQAVIHPGIIPVTQKKFALLGGRYSKKVTVFEFVENFGSELIFSDVENFPDIVETVYPLVHFKAGSKVFILKIVDGSAPKVLFYNFANLCKEDFELSRKGIKLPPLNNKPSELGAY